MATARFSSDVVPFTSSKWKGVLIRKPSDVKTTDQRLTLRSGKDTDWWRTAAKSIPESNVDRNTGPLYVFEVADENVSWTAGVWIAVDHTERFQQATIFLGQGDYQHERQPWLKAGVEIEDDKQNIGSVVAAPVSDWGLFPVTQPITPDKGHWLYVEAKRTDADVIVSYAIGSPDDEPAKHLMREVKGFAKDLGAPWHVGVMTCGPKSEETISTFHHFTFTQQ